MFWFGAVSSTNLACFNASESTRENWAREAADAAITGSGTALKSQLGSVRFRSNILMDNVRTFDVWVYTETDLVDGVADYNSVDDGLPVYIEIYVEVLSAEAARQEAFSGESRVGDLDRQRYFRRVYLNNQMTSFMGVGK